MTLDLRTISPIAGEGPMRVREILRRSLGGFRQDWLSDVFHYSPQKASEVAAALEFAGYVERDRGRERGYAGPFPWYVVTKSGWVVARASAARRITRDTAKEALQGFVNRIKIANANQRYLFFVRKAVVFGSYLEVRENLGDVDIALDLQPRIPPDKGGRWVEIYRQHAWDSGRTFATFEAELDWPRREVLLFLKSHKRSISIQPWFSFVELGIAEDFRFKVLHGDPGEIRREMARARRDNEEAHSRIQRA